MCQSEEVLAFQPAAPLAVQACYRKGPFLATRPHTLLEDQVCSLALALRLLWIQTSAEG